MQVPSAAGCGCWWGPSNCSRGSSNALHSVAPRVPLRIENVQPSRGTDGVVRYEIIVVPAAPTNVARRYRAWAALHAALPAALRAALPFFPPKRLMLPAFLACLGDAASDRDAIASERAKPEP